MDGCLRFQLGLSGRTTLKTLRPDSFSLQPPISSGAVLGSAAPPCCSAVGIRTGELGLTPRKRGEARRPPALGRQLGRSREERVVAVLLANSHQAGRQAKLRPNAEANFLAAPSAPARKRMRMPFTRIDHS